MGLNLQDLELALSVHNFLVRLERKLPQHEAEQSVSLRLRLAAWFDQHATLEQQRLLLRNRQGRAA